VSSVGDVVQGEFDSSFHYVCLMSRCILNEWEQVGKVSFEVVVQVVL